MKKYNKFISLLLSLVMTFSALFSIVVYADGIEERPTCLVDHFSNLTKSHANVYKNRIPINTIGTCTHVAMSMLLSYYDSYWSDDFVAEEIEWDKGIYNSSTDKLSETFTASSEAYDWNAWKNAGGDFRSFAAANENTYLHPYMFEFANDEVIIDNLGIVGLLDFQVKNVLEAYLYDVCGFNENQVTVNIQYAIIDGDDSLISTMKEQILNGNPVIFFGLNVDILPTQLDNDTMALNGHAMIGYDVGVDAEGNDDIILHTGWSGNEDSRVSTTEYQYLNSIVWIEINEENLSHECAYNYTDTFTGSNMCACEIYCGTHPSGTHTYRNDYVSYTSSGHIKACTRCGEEILESHNVTSHIPYTNEWHKGICDCGYAKNLPHVVRPATGITGTCILCGATVTINGPTIGLNSIRYVAASGSYVLSNGVIVISDADYEAYLSGELDLNELIYSDCCTE